jgi:sugar O-acyltransferase (sialic acid O-acetyltransferase NeuD family)
MKRPPDLIVICAGGHSRVVIDVLQRAGQIVAAVIDADTARHGQKIDGIPIIGGDDAIFARSTDEVVLVNGLGNIPMTGSSDLDRRRALFERFSSRGYTFAPVISRDAIVSKSAVLIGACHIITGAILHPGVVVDNDAIVNTGAIVDHDCRIGAHSHIAPGAVLSGGVIVEPECHIGAGAVILQNIRIGAGAIVGAGAVVVEAVPAGATVLGSPARLSARAQARVR